MRLSATTTRLNEARLVDRAKALAQRRREAVPQQPIEVSNGERELGAAAGDLRQPDER
ncbi:MAG: hypothetical protein WC829_16630 [Hyphomicrobium sp.]